MNICVFIPSLSEIARDNLWTTIDAVCSFEKCCKIIYDDFYKDFVRVRIEKYDCNFIKILFLHINRHQ